MKTIEVELTFTEDILGTCPNDEDIYKNFIIDKAKAAGAQINAQDEADEVEALPLSQEIEKGMTVFPRNEDGKPFLYDYQVKGFFKDTCGALKNLPEMKSSKIKAHKKKIDQLVFPFPRQIVFENAEMDICQRPLRADTMQGPRVALAMSEAIKAGATIRFEVNCLQDGDVELVREWLDYGKFRGIGQWRNSSKGRFTWKEIRVY